MHRQVQRHNAEEKKRRREKIFYRFASHPKSNRGKIYFYLCFKQCSSKELARRTGASSMPKYMHCDTVAEKETVHAYEPYQKKYYCSLKRSYGAVH